MSQPLVAVTSDVMTFERRTWHAAAEQYLAAVHTTAGVIPVIVPSFGNSLDIDAILDRMDGVVATGSKSNVHPSSYGVEPSLAHEPYDVSRDATALPLLRRAVDRGIPVLAICRGMQELNVALGGTLATEIQNLVGRGDHRAPVSESQAERFAIRHRVDLAPGSCLAAILDSNRANVNSLHRQAIERTAPGVAIEARAADGTVEAISLKHSRAYVVGVQWHPEYWVATDDVSRRIFASFGDAVRQHALNRQEAEPHPMLTEPN